MAASLSTCNNSYLYIQSPRKIFFILTVHSFSFLPYLHNLSHKLTELNVALLLCHKTDFLQKHLMKTTNC